MTQEKFWQEEPLKPFKDWRTYWIGLPVLSSAWGASLFMFLAFSFTELSAIPDAWRTWIVIVAAFSTAFGSAFGSIGSSVEVYTKAFEGRARKLDWISLALSVAAMLGGFVLGFAALLGGADWATFVLLYGPIALSVLVAGDAASDVIQLGGLFASYNLRYEQWRQAKMEWEAAEARGEHAPPEWTTATIQDFKTVQSRLNGNGAALNAEQLEEELAREFKLLPSESTVKRWLKMARS